MPGERLWELVYPELRKRAKAIYGREAAGGTLSATAILNSRCWSTRATRC